MYNACGALGAVEWIKSKQWMRENPKADAFKNPVALKILNVFNRVADGEILVINYVESTFELLTNILSKSI